jgi:hypothetical protein
MAPRTIARRFTVSLVLILLICGAILPYTVAAAPLGASRRLPDLQTFSLSVRDGAANELRGVYVDGLFALQVEQQPRSSPGFVSIADNSVTQFSLASQFGNVGLLAHNFLSGQYFFQLSAGQRIYLIYGDGRIEPYQVATIFQYQATDPSSLTSNFIDLATNKRLSANELFTRVYRGPKHLTLQTCITKNLNSSWGRLFVIAEPASAPTSGILGDSQVVSLQ